MYLLGDFETRSEAELKGTESVGLHNYSIHPSTKALMFGYAIVKDISVTLSVKDVSLWKLWEDELMPADLKQGLDSDIPIVSWNSTFERYIFKNQISIEIPVIRFQDPQPSARYFSMTGDLEDDGRVLGLPSDLAKEHKGKELIKMFSLPTVIKATKKREGKIFFKDWDTNPVEWLEFCEYCKQDVVAELEMMRRLAIVGAFPLPQRERKIWLFDQKVNDRGMPVDVDFVRKAYNLGVRAKQAAVEAQNKLTGLENSNSNPQMLAWARKQGYQANTLRKDRVTVALKYERDKMTPLCIQALEARAAASSTTYKKLAAILRQVSPDGRLRNQFIYMGSARCGRWSGNAVQLHNMARPDKRFENKKNVDKGRALIYAEDYDGIIREFGKSETDYGAVLLTIKNLIRTVFVASNS